VPSGIASAEARGTAVIEVKLAPATWDIVQREVYSWKFTALRDEAGEPVVLGGMRIEYAERLSQGQLREALQMLTNEYFTVRYTKFENEKVTDLIRVTGARLLFGTYYFIEHGERLVVVKEPAPR